MNERIRKIRKENHMNQSELGKVLGISRNAIANLENKRTELNETITELICLKFNINKHWLETGEGEMHVKNNLDDKISELYNSLPDAHKIIVRNFITKLLDNMPEPIQITQNVNPEPQQEEPVQMQKIARTTDRTFKCEIITDNSVKNELENLTEEPDF
jgi:DNA-binding XRE family transcriptional regulator